MTKYLQFNDEDLHIAGEIVRKGGLVAFPTETVYGLGANALDPEAVKSIYVAKGRPSDNPLIVHIYDKSQLNEIASRISEDAEKVVSALMPGSITVVFPKKSVIDDCVTGGLNTVAVRMPSSKEALAFLKSCNVPVAAPSANTSGRPSPTRAEHVAEDLDGRIEMIVDGGPVEIGVESTILDMTVTPPMILRPGAVTREMLEELIGEVAVDQTLLKADSRTAPKAPGMKYRHYAPKANLVVVEGEVEKVTAWIRETAATKQQEGKRVGIIATEETKESYPDGDVKVAGTRADEATIASSLYGILREFDGDGVDEIYSEAFASGGIGAAVMNRLLKAAGHQVIRIT